MTATGPRADTAVGEHSTNGSVCCRVVRSDVSVPTRAGTLAASRDFGEAGQTDATA